MRVRSRGWALGRNPSQGLVRKGRAGRKRNRGRVGQKRNRAGSGRAGRRGAGQKKSGRAVVAAVAAVAVGAVAVSTPLVTTRRSGTGRERRRSRRPRMQRRPRARRRVRRVVGSTPSTAAPPRSRSNELAVGGVGVAFFDYSVECILVKLSNASCRSDLDASRLLPGFATFSTLACKSMCSWFASALKWSTSVNDISDFGGIAPFG